MTSRIVFMLGLGLVSCGDCREVVDALPPVPSGEFVITERCGHHCAPWLVGADLSIDTDAETAILRYIRNGSEFTVLFRLDEFY